jgi:hypothetical protein
MAAIVQHFLADGATAITGVQLSNILAGTTGTPLKFGVKNVGDRPLGNAFNSATNVTLSIVATPGNDGSTRFRAAADASGTLSPPFGFTATLGAAADGGVWGATGEYEYVAVAKNGTGATIGSSGVTVQVDDTTKRVTLAAPGVTGATTYDLYRTATPGTYGASTFLANVGAGAINFVDDGSATGAGTPPLTNTTGGAGPTYGTPPAGLNTAVSPFLIGQSPGTLEVGEMDFYWINRVVPSNSTPAGNPRQARIRTSEI